MTDNSQRSEIWKRLTSGMSLDGLGLRTKDGRFVLPAQTFGSLLPVKSRLREDTGVVAIESTVIRGVTWRGIDFSSSVMPNLRFVGCRLEDCVFDHCRCRDWRVWKTTVDTCSFVGADLRDSVIGGVIDNARNIYRNVDFTDANLMGTVYLAALFVSCIFRNANLKKIDFQTSSFVDCLFVGELKNVIFYKQAFGGEEFPPNEMTRVDFLNAHLRFVEFRGLDLSDVLLPQNDDNIIVCNYRETLDRIIRILSSRTDVASRTLTAYLGVVRKWAGARQTRGVLSKEDIVEIGGQQALQELLVLLNEQAK